MEAFEEERSRSGFVLELNRLTGEVDPIESQRAQAFVRANPKWVSEPLMENQNTALHIAAEAGSVQMAIALIEAGADVEALNVADETPLMKACEAADGALETVRALLEAGASANGSSLVCRGALDRVARSVRRRPIEESEALFVALVKGGAPMETAWEEMTSIMSNKGDQGSKQRLMGALLGSGLSINLMEKRGDTALSRACVWADNSGELDPVVFLLSKGANPNVSLVSGSLLRLCAQSRHLMGRVKESDDLVRLLLEFGANPLALERDGTSVAELARDEKSKVFENEGARVLIVSWLEKKELEEGCSATRSKRQPAL